MGVLACPYKHYEFPFRSKLDLSGLVEYWRGVAKKPSLRSSLAQSIVSYFDKHPEIHGPLEDFSIVERHEAFLEDLFSAILPMVGGENEMIAVFVPYTFEVLYATDGFKKLFMSNEKKLIPPKALNPSEMAYNKAVHAYGDVLQNMYGMSYDLDMPMIFEDDVEETGLYRSFKIEFNDEFSVIKAVGKKPELTSEELQKLTNNVEDIDLLEEHLPSNLFEFHGLVVYRFIDITQEAAVSALKFELLEDDSLIDEQKFSSVQRHMRTLLQMPDLRLGVSVFQKDRSRFVNTGADNKHSIMMEGVKDDTKCSTYFGDAPSKMAEEQKALILEDVTAMKDVPPFVESLISQGLRNVLVAPLFYQGTFSGLLELGSPRVGQLKMATTILLKEVMPLFAIAVKRSADETERKVQAIIKEQFTAIHPVVEWKFVEEAFDYLDASSQGSTPDMQPIVFPDVYPLYAATDIRGSSTERNRAIQTDLIVHLQMVQEVMKKASSHYQMPILDELSFKVDAHLHKIEDGLFSGDEVTVLDFLKQEIEPCFDHFLNSDPSVELKEAIVGYQETIDPHLGMLYRHRKAFEDSLTAINEAVSSHIEKVEQQAQKMFPHYFEKYKTDGVEYNIYVGQSLTKEHSFTKMHLRNLRLWQLITICETAWITEDLKPHLALPLDTTHLVLVHSSPLAIKFRIDEKQFDVDGAYNIRYEIIKKRIDKAIIRDTDERLTQPGKIAIVYAQEKEAAEYQEYLRYMAYKGYVHEEIEFLELEALQGVQGLKALRVSVKYADTLQERNGKALDKEHSLLVTA